MKIEVVKVKYDLNSKYLRNLIVVITSFKENDWM